MTKLPPDFNFALGPPLPRVMAKQLYIETVGCQMNMLDSELVVAALRKAGYELTDSATKADTFPPCGVCTTR